MSLTLKESQGNTKIPIEAETISPDIFLNKSIEQIAELFIWRGNRQVPLKELFTISIDSNLNCKLEELKIILQGDLSNFKRIGQEMTGGEILINSSIGMHLGFQMKGGKIVVNGDADDFAGANMEGGELIIKGNAGHYLGGSIRGDWRGMLGGKIYVEGNVGNETGVWMRNGLIKIGGNAPMFLGMHMHKGLIIIDGDVEERVGAEMTGGVIVVKGTLHKLLPSFAYQKKIKEIKVEYYEEIKGNFIEFIGDLAERKQGLLYLDESKNSFHFNE
ncbi:MAG: formylmethanofuran dehydrogenase subunit C [Candidatus Heimdallarchaeota archaeon]|nr:formylmethanofuran dehydrogenase subunit C [Candidatus Heimdallarchaeota archaeon]